MNSDKEACKKINDLALKSNTLDHVKKLSKTQAVHSLIHHLS